MIAGSSTTLSTVIAQLSLLLTVIRLRGINPDWKWNLASPVS